MRLLLLILFFIGASTLHAKRAEMSIDDIQSLSTHAFIGYTKTLENGEYKIIVLKRLSGPNDLIEVLRVKQLPPSKPSENPEIGKSYLIFSKKKSDSEHVILRRLEIGDFQILDSEMIDQKIKTKCDIATVSCLLK